MGADGAEESSRAGTGAAISCQNLSRTFGSVHDGQRIRRPVLVHVSARDRHRHRDPPGSGR
jgi:hypothetical protein